ncbi:hypothetical protein [Nocardioides sp.]|uniref:hypothetical protein n=1 Tax=Nocardioides sp. TaxID=35761 RepID=UPI002B2693A7|nr:hypothetical protein [Nocardioides sp.]
MKTGAHLAWSTPVILAASSLPAHGVAASGGVVTMAAGAPSTTRPNDTIRVSCVISNLGTEAPASMDAVVRLTPLVGEIGASDLVSNNTEYEFISQSVGPDRVVTAIFRKLDPQIAPSAPKTLQFSFQSIADPTSTLRKGTINVLPSVPQPGTGTPGSNDYE